MENTIGLKRVLNKMLVISAGIHKVHVRIANREHSDQTQTCLLLRFLRIFYAFWAAKYALRITITELRTRESKDFYRSFHSF